MNPTKQALVLALFIVACFAAAGIGAFYTTPSIPDWYAGLRKPTWTPPGWVFGPVWALLYLSMAVAAWLVWRHAGFSGAVVPLTIFAVQLALNLAWSIVFFGKHDVALAVVDIALLWFAIVATVFAFRHVSSFSAWLLVPYILWVTFASALNVAIWRMNR
jgi:translocator protein